MLPELRYPSTAQDWRRLAERRLPRFLFDYVDGGAGDERTLAANVEDFAAVRLRQRVLVDVDRVDTSAPLAGQRCSLPLALAPIGLAGPKGMDTRVVKTLHDAFRKAMNDPGYARTLEQNDQEPIYMGHEEYTRYAIAQTSREKVFVQELGIKLD